jgi:segregation and condensation protein B
MNPEENSINNERDLSKELEAVLFWKGEPVSIKKLSQILEKPEDEINLSLKELKEKIEKRGVNLIWKDDEVTLGTSKDTSALIEKLRKDELIRDLGKAGLETLSIIIYKGPISRAEIDYIRGVQSTFIIRNLMIRGLIEKISNPTDQRSFLYRPTFDLLSFLGVTKIEEMPEFLKVKEEFESYKNNQEPENQKEEANPQEQIMPEEQPEEIEGNEEKPEKDLTE